MKKTLMICAEKAGKDGEMKLASDGGESEKVLVNE
jgi:hypothetical protein